MPISELIVRCGAFAFFGISALYGGLSLLSAQARRRYAKPAQGDVQREALAAAGVRSMEDWHRLPTAAQEAADTAAINQQGQPVTTDAASVAVEHVARINALIRF
jgi:hypothetical protein